MPVGVFDGVDGNGENVGSGVTEGVCVVVFVTAVCVSAIAVPTTAKAVSIAVVGCVLGVGRKLLHEAKITNIGSNEIIALRMMFNFPVPFVLVTYRLTVCVTCAGAGTAKPSSQKKAEA